MPPEARCDYRFFDTLETEIQGYILGFLFADGCNYQQMSIDLELQKRDIEILKLIKEKLKVPSTISHRQSRNSVCLKIHSKHLASRAAEIGLIPQKSFKLKFPDLPSHLIRHFIRGFFDGNGNLTDRSQPTCNRYRYNINIISTPSFCESLASVINIFCGLNCKVFIPVPYRDKVNKIALLILDGRENIKKFLHWIYDDSTYKLQRKWKLAQFIFNEVFVNKCHKNVA